MGKPSAKQLILAAMDREGITWEQVRDRIIRDEGASVWFANCTIERTINGNGISLAAAAAIITLISDKKA